MAELVDTLGAAGGTIDFAGLISIGIYAIAAIFIAGFFAALIWLLFRFLGYKYNFVVAIPYHDGAYDFIIDDGKQVTKNNDYTYKLRGLREEVMLDTSAQKGKYRFRKKGLFGMATRPGYCVVRKGRNDYGTLGFDHEDYSMHSIRPDIKTAGAIALLQAQKDFQTTEKWMQIAPWAAIGLVAMVCLVLVVMAFEQGPKMMTQGLARWDKEIELVQEKQSLVDKLRAFDAEEGFIETEASGVGT